MWALRILWQSCKNISACFGIDYFGGGRAHFLLLQGLVQPRAALGGLQRPVTGDRRTAEAVLGGHMHDGAVFLKKMNEYVRNVLSFVQGPGVTHQRNHVKHFSNFGATEPERFTEKSELIYEVFASRISPLETNYIFFFLSVLFQTNILSTTFLSSFSTLTTLP